MIKSPYLRDMARATIQVIQALREAASKLEHSDKYQWGHMGHCNCGFLAQVVTQKSAPVIHKAAMQGQGDWSEQLNDYCPLTGFGLDVLINELMVFGFDRDDLIHLERLTDPIVLEQFPESLKPLRHNSKADVIQYFRRWAACLESDWASRQSPLLFNAFEEGVEKEYSPLVDFPG